ncbi:hypothetical protein [Paenibacillus sp. HB172176]|nr:hypothetical protein [Paenibacillus sp. HB172176]
MREWSEAAATKDEDSVQPAQSGSEMIILSALRSPHEVIGFYRGMA